MQPPAIFFVNLFLYESVSFFEKVLRDTHPRSFWHAIGLLKSEEPVKSFNQLISACG